MMESRNGIQRIAVLFVLALFLGMAAPANAGEVIDPETCRADCKSDHQSCKQNARSDKRECVKSKGGSGQK